MKKLISTILVLVVCLAGIYVFSLTRSEIRQTRNEITELKEKNEKLTKENKRLYEIMFVQDTIPVYVVKGVKK
jgi:cell division protein FtsL